MNKQNMNSTEQREIEFHDSWASEIDPKSVNVDAVGQACTMPETQYILKKIGDLSQKKILELGCGGGEASVYFAKKGAVVTATDVSPGMTRLTEKVAALHGVKISTAVVSTDHLPFEDHSFDIVYVANVLHHVDYNLALSEIKRVLRPGGTFVQWDPVKYNPAINVYRRKAQKVRTVDEHPIDKSYIKVLSKYFSDYSLKGFWLTTCLIFVRYYFIEKIDPNEVRYWKRVVDDADVLVKRYSRLEKIDRFILRLIPPLKWWCWNMVIMATKQES